MTLRRKNKLAVLKALVDPMVKYYCIVVTLILFITRISALVAGDEWVLYGQDITRLFLLALCGIAPSFFNIFVETNSAKFVIALRALGFALTVVLVVVMHVLLSGTGVSTNFIITFLLVYAIMFVYSSVYIVVININDKKVAEHINKQLAEIHDAESETHTH